MSPFDSDDADEGSVRGVAGLAIGAVVGLGIWAAAFAAFRVVADALA